MARWLLWDRPLVLGEGVGEGAVIWDHRLNLVVVHQAHVRRAGEQFVLQIRTVTDEHLHGMLHPAPQTHLQMVVAHRHGMHPHERPTLMLRMEAEPLLGMPIPGHQIPTLGMRVPVGGAEPRREDLLLLLLLAGGVPLFGNPILGEIQMTTPGEGMEQKPLG
jgi:hypothetical protein